MKRSIDPTQKAFWRKPLFYLQLIAMAQVASRLFTGLLRVTSLRIPDRDLGSRTLVTPQENPDWETVSRATDLIFDTHCCLHEGQGLQSYPDARPDYIGPKQAFAVDA